MQHSDASLALIIGNMIDQAYKDRHDLNNDPFRSHLGGSMIGRSCDREIWYGFRWAAAPDFDGRMLRLFDRGHEEEFVFVDTLRNAGWEVQDYSKRLLYDTEDGTYDAVDWGFDHKTYGAHWIDVSESKQHIQLAAKVGFKLKQWRISNHSNHFGGSLDGKGTPPSSLKIPDLNTQMLLEFKTHNDASFKKLVLEGVKKAKPEHWAQMQTYMEHEDLDAALYCAVCKNDDKRHFEIVRRDREAGAKFIERARRIIYTTKAPDRVGTHPSWYECKFCSYSKICHYNEPPHRNCRSCKFAQPVENGEWYCNQHNGVIPVDFIMKTCDGYQAIHD